MDPPADSPQHFAVGPGQAGVRLDAFLAEALGASRAEARRLLEGGGVAVDGRPVAVRDKGRSLQAGAEVAVARFREPAQRQPEPQSELPLTVLAEGRGWLAVDKPPGVAVHPLVEGERGSLLGAAIARRPELLGVGEGALRSGVVHRLDVDTSGVLLFATEEQRWRELRSAFQEGRVEKRYRALALGRLEGSGCLEVEMWVARHRPARVRVASRPADKRRGRPVVLAWRSLEILGDVSLVELRPRTGFLHQIRAGLAHLGHPLAGDALYAASEVPDTTGAGRHMLHASELAVDDVAARAPDAPDFAALLERLRG